MDTRFKPGREKTGGRKKGTPNATTVAVMNGLAEIVCDNLAKLREDLNGMRPKERAEVLAKLLPYVVPRKLEADITETTMTPEEAAAEFMRLTD